MSWSALMMVGIRGWHLTLGQFSFKEITGKSQVWFVGPQKNLIHDISEPFQYVEQRPGLTGHIQTHDISGHWQFRFSTQWDRH